MLAIRWFGSLLRRLGAFISSSWALSPEAGLYPDPLHLGPAFGMLYSDEARAERELIDRATGDLDSSQDPRERNRL